MRRKKETPKTYLPNGLEKGQEIICPVCGKRYKASEHTQYRVKAGRPCSLACFTIYRYEYAKEPVPEYYKKEYRKILKERKLKNESR